jgi:hypothetical protein
MDLFSFLSLHFMYVTVTVVIGDSVALSRRSHLFSTMSSLHDVLVHDTMYGRRKMTCSSAILSQPLRCVRDNCTVFMLITLLPTGETTSGPSMLYWIVPTNQYT